MTNKLAKRILKSVNGLPMIIASQLVIAILNIDNKKNIDKSIKYTMLLRNEYLKQYN